jgi:DNA-binding response OmpR family regulator
MSGPKTILLVDDDVNLQAMIKIILKTKNYNVIVGNNGLEGLEQLKTVKPDLIILDLNMPKMGGLEFHQRIRDENNKPKYPVLILTARANMEDIVNLLPVDGFMSKPFEIKDLLKQVEIIIDKYAGPGAGPSPS